MQAKQAQVYAQIGIAVLQKGMEATQYAKATRWLSFCKPPRK